MKFLYNFFGWVPIVGPIIKGAYIGSLVSKIVAVSKGWIPNESMRQQSGKDLDDALADEANDLIYEVTEPLDLGLLENVVRHQAVKKIVPIMRKKIIA